jgi:hypothetical protein
MKYNRKIKGKEKILHAAVKTVSGYVVLGKCHADCFYSGKNMGFEMSSKSADQGFVTNKGRYVGRVDAARIAKLAGQLDPNDRKRKVSALLSEDIWYQRERFEYNQCRGYFEVKK